VDIPSPADWGQRLRQQRLAAELSQEELAARAGTTQSTVSQVELGNRRPDLDVQVALAEALAVPVTELFPRTVEEAELAAETRRRREEGGQ
jgi:transcriptional regulator with XRE-family HTH domain